MATLRYRPGEPGCIPDGYFINLQTDPAFGETNLLGEFGIPGNTVFTDPLTDCTPYYWKVLAVQGGGYGPESDVGWFYTNESGSCPPTPFPGTARMNTFCREGTYPKYWPDAMYLFMEGDFVEVIARNPFTTYLLVNIPVEDGDTPRVAMKSCWTILDAIRFWGYAQVPEGLEAVSPPPTPTPTPVPYCHINMDPESCLAAGGTPNYTNKYCECP